MTDVSALEAAVREGVVRCLAHTWATPEATCPACVAEQVADRALSSLAQAAREAVACADGAEFLKNCCEVALRKAEVRAEVLAGQVETLRQIADHIDDRDDYGPNADASLIWIRNIARAALDASAGEESS